MLRKFRFEYLKICIFISLTKVSCSFDKNNFETIDIEAFFKCYRYVNNRFIIYKKIVFTIK